MWWINKYAIVKSYPLPGLVVTILLLFQKNRLMKGFGKAIRMLCPKCTSLLPSCPQMSNFWFSKKKSGLSHYGSGRGLEAQDHCLARARTNSALLKSQSTIEEQLETTKTNGKPRKRKPVHTVNHSCQKASSNRFRNCSWKARAVPVHEGVTPTLNCCEQMLPSGAALVPL